MKKMEETSFFYTEKDFRKYFENNLDKFGVKEIIINQEVCPDYVLIMNGKRKPVKAEAELFDTQFKYDHRDQLGKVDIVLCCYGKSEKILGKPVIALHKLYELNNPSKEPRKKMGRLSEDEWEMLEFIAGYRRVSFAEIISCENWSGEYCLSQMIPPKLAKGAFRGYPLKDNLFSMATREAIEHMRKYCHVLLADGLSKDACETFNKLRLRGLIALVPSNFLIYSIDGRLFDPRLWIATEIMVTEKALKRYKSRLDVFRLAHKMIEQIR
jgi:hypothetical protein